MARHNFRNLKVWQDRLQIVGLSYKCTERFPKSELYYLTNQINRCALSIPSNIAEGTAKSTDRHLKTYLETSLGSTYKWENQMEAAKLVRYVQNEEYSKLLDKIHQI